LSEVMMWFLYSQGGFPFLILCFAFLGVIIFSLIYFTFPGRPFLMVPLLILSYSAIQLVWGVRPQIFNILLLALFIYVLEGVRWKRLNWKWLYGLPFLILLWANLHSGYFMGIMVLMIYLAGGACEVFCFRSEQETLSPKILRHLVQVLLLCFLFSIVNPNGYHLWIYPFMTLKSKVMQEHIDEWQSPNFHRQDFWPFLILLGLGVLSFMFLKKRARSVDVFLFLSTLAAALLSRRHIPFFAIAVIPMLSRNLMEIAQSSRLGEFLSGKLPDAPMTWPKNIFNGLVILAGILGVSFFVFSKISNNEQAILKKYPVTAVDFLLKKGISGKRIYNEYAWGGYLIWREVPVFIDGRADMYGDQFFSSYLDTYQLKKDWEAPLRKFQVDHILISSQGALHSFFSIHPKWKEIHQDKTASVFLRRGSY